jgi:hypothetical protein
MAARRERAFSRSFKMHCLRGLPDCRVGTNLFQFGDKQTSSFRVGSLNFHYFASKNTDCHGFRVRQAEAAMGAQRLRHRHLPQTNSPTSNDYVHHSRITNIPRAPNQANLSTHWSRQVCKRDLHVPNPSLMRRVANIAHNLRRCQGFGEKTWVD